MDKFKLGLDTIALALEISMAKVADYLHSDFMMPDSMNTR